MDVIKRIGQAGLVPVVVLENAKDAVPVAKAILRGGIDVMEITFRTDAAAEAIAAVAAEYPDMILGAGTVVSTEQCELAVKAGASFIVTPGYNEEVVSWCLERGVAVIPGCVTPGEIIKARAQGLKVLKFFPSNVYGGLSAMKSLTGPFPDVSFIPTGGIRQEDLGEYGAAPFVHAVGGSWLCPQESIAKGDYDEIFYRCEEGILALLNYELDSARITCDTEQKTSLLSQLIVAATRFGLVHGKSRTAPPPRIEAVHSDAPDDKGYMCMRSNKLECAVVDLERRNYQADMSTAEYEEGRLVSVDLKEKSSGAIMRLVLRK